MRASTHSARRDETYDRLVLQEELILDVTERLTEALRQAGVTKAELARRLDRTPGFVTQVLAGGRNLTLRTISDIAGALSLEPAFQLSLDRRCSTEPVLEPALSPVLRPAVPQWKPCDEKACVPAFSPLDVRAA